MVEVKIFYRKEDGNRGQLKSVHKYKTAKEAKEAKLAFIRIFRGRNIIAPIDSEVIKARKERRNVEEVSQNSFWCEFTPIDTKKPLMHINMPKIEPKDATNKEICKNLLAPLYHWKHETTVTKKKQVVSEYNVTRNEKYVVI